MGKLVWERPQLRAIELEEVESLADLEMAFTTICCVPIFDC